MNSEQYKARLKTLSLTQQQAADLMDISIRTSAAYATDQYAIPTIIGLYLDLLAQSQPSPAAIQQQIKKHRELKARRHK